MLIPQETLLQAEKDLITLRRRQVKQAQTHRYALLQIQCYASLQHHLLD